MGYLWSNKAGPAPAGGTLGVRPGPRFDTPSAPRVPQPTSPDAGRPASPPPSPIGVRPPPATGDGFLWSNKAQPAGGDGFLWSNMPPPVEPERPTGQVGPPFQAPQQGTTSKSMGQPTAPAAETTSPVGGMQPSGGTAGQPAQPAPTMMTRVPNDAEFAALAGQQIMTPWGPVVGDEAGRPRLVLDDAGRAAFTQAKAASISRFGAVPGWAQTPGALPPPVEVGRANFNPFTGQWTGVDDTDSRIV